MPLYDYRCAKCHQTFEVRLAYADVGHARPACPKCRSRKTKRQVSIGLARRSKSRQRLTREQVEAAVGLAQAAGLGGPADAGHAHGSGHSAEHSHEH